MTFVTGTLNNANPGVTLYNTLETTLLALGFTLEDTVVIGTRTHKVLKSAAAGNARGLDWYLDFSYTTTGAGYIMMCPFEGYTAGADTGLRGPYSVSDTTIETTNYSRFGATQSALETNWANSTNHTALQTPVVASTNFNYWASITRDRVVLFLSNDSSMHYCGFFIPTAAHISQAGASLYPLIVARWLSGQNAVASTSVGSVSAAITRAPKFPDISTTYVQSGGWGNICSVRTPPELYTGIAGQQVHPGSGEVQMSPRLVLFGGTSAGIGTMGIVGTLDGVVEGSTIASAVRGDTVTIGGDLYYMIPRNGFPTTFVKAA